MDSQRRAQLQAASVRPLGTQDPPRVGPYELESKLGEGGMGAVYLGRRPGGQLVAVKVVRTELASDPAFLARFHDEVANAQRVASFCTAQVLDHGQDAGRAYMVTEYIDGPSMLQHVSENGELSPGMLHGVAVGVAAALVAIHAAGLVHRDLKPSNVLLSISGPRVIDFGIARALDVASSHTATGQVIGSPGWIAPEQILNRQITPAVDIFAWGCLVAFAGNGRNPFGTGPFQVMAARVVHAEPEVGRLPSSLAGLVRRALDKDPANRPSAQELLLSLVGGGGEAAVSTTLGEAWPDPAAGRPQPGPPQSPVAPAAGHAQPAPPQSPAGFRQEPGTHPRTEAVRDQGTHPRTEAVRDQGTHPRTEAVRDQGGYPRTEAAPDRGAHPRAAAAYGAPMGPLGETTTDPVPAPSPWGPPGAPPDPRPGKPERQRRVLLAVVAGVAVATAGVGGGVYALQAANDDNKSKGNTGGGAAASADPNVMPTDPMLVRIDSGAAGCHSKIGLLNPVSGKQAKPQELNPGQGCDSLPQWSPDHSAIAFSRRNADGVSSAWVMNADGTGEHKIGDKISGRLAWSPDGQRLAAIVGVAGATPQIYIADKDGSNTQRLTNDEVRKDDPSWSKDGKLAFWARQGGSQQIYYLEPGNQDTWAPGKWTAVTTKATAPDGADDPHWSPDGKLMAYTLEHPNGKHDIAVVDEQGHSRRLTKDPALDMDPSWSRNGKWIAFVRGNVPTPQIWAMPVDGKEKTDARAIAPKLAGHPAWS